MFKLLFRANVVENHSDPGGHRGSHLRHPSIHSDYFPVRTSELTTQPIFDLHMGPTLCHSVHFGLDGFVVALVSRTSYSIHHQVGWSACRNSTCQAGKYELDCAAELIQKRKLIYLHLKFYFYLLSSFKFA